MPTPFTRLWSVLRGDRHMLNADPAAPGATPDAATAGGDAAGAAQPGAV